ncbi:phenylalanine--tRNA ligase [Caerostris extrusa]|uniref:Phenylalanine--tRNA ligase n=1 Tax=Caerostris extrusa TaxID=172846 RepID=A0AAV4T8Q2_CAEEX|nr:phenylalanine--tRNA ligase [Caerostris extrusa]
MSGDNYYVELLMQNEIFHKLYRKKESFDSLEFAIQLRTNQKTILDAAEYLQSLKRHFITIKQQVFEREWKLTSEGEKVVADGSYEARIFSAIPPEGIALQKLLNSVPRDIIGFNRAMLAGWIYPEEKDGATLVFRKVDTIVD